MKFLPNLETRSLATLIFTYAIIAASALSATAHAGKLYKWVDSKGRISYQDQPPPENAKVLNETTFNDKAKPALETPANVTVDVYTTKNCSSCEKMIKELKELGVAFTEKDLQDNREIQNQIIAETNSLNVPAVFIADKLVTINYSNDLQFELKKAGYKFPEGQPTAPDPEPATESTGGDESTTE